MSEYRAYARVVTATALSAAVVLMSACEQKQSQAPAAQQQAAANQKTATERQAPQASAETAAQAPTTEQPAGAPAPTTASQSAEAPAQSTTRSVGTTIDDSGLTMRVKSAFVADPDIKSLDITVETRKGEVQLSGYVDSQAQIDRAVDIAKRTDGVTGVQNKLALKTPGSVGDKVDDAIITTKVKTALIRDDNVRARDIAVNTNNGEVQLSGFVANQDQVNRATEVARSIEGVKSVDNKMSVKR